MIFGLILMEVHALVDCISFKLYHYRISPRLDPAKRGHYAFSMSNTSKKRKAKAVMLGVGLDTDGHKRLTTGHNFVLTGGTEQTHEEMTETAIKINEKLKQRGKHLETVTRDEFDDIAHEVGLKKFKPRNNS